MKKLLVVLLLISNSLMGQERIQTIESGLMMLTNSPVKVDEQLRNKGFQLVGKSGPNQRIWDYEKRAQNGTYMFTVAVLGTKVTTVSWIELLMYTNDIAMELRELGFVSAEGAGVVRLQNQTILGFQNLKSNLLVTLILDNNENVVKITLGSKK